MKKTVIACLSIFVCLLNTGCNGPVQSYDEIYQSGYDKGYKEGYEQGSEKAQEERSWEDRYDAGYDWGYSEGSHAGYGEGYSEGLYEIPDDIASFGSDSYYKYIDSLKALHSDDNPFNLASDLLFSIQEDHPEIYKQIIDAYGIDDLPTVYEYYVLDEENKICHTSKCSVLKDVNPYTATTTQGIDSFTLSYYGLCPVCGKEVTDAVQNLENEASE